MKIKVNKRTNWFITIGFTVFAIMVLIFLGSTNADAVVEYDDSNTIYASRTKEDVGKKYSEGRYLGESYRDYNEETYYSEKASLVSPYNAGTLTDDTVKSMQGMTNFYRWLVGVDNLNVDCVPTPELQYQALDRNFEFAHTISNDSKPEDMSDELWQKGFECNHNILAWGYTPQNSITGWMNEGYNLNNKSWDTLGHRYVLINPAYIGVQFGYCGKVAIGDIVNYNFKASHKDFFSAFPSAGYMPNNLVYPSQCAWSVDFDTNVIKVNNYDDVCITVTNDFTKESYICRESDYTASVGTSRCCFVQPSDYSKDNFKYNDNYTVKITGLTDTATGQEASFTYHVKFFDVNEYAKTYVKSAQPEEFSNLVIYKTLNDTESLKKIGAILPDKVTVIGETGLRVKNIPVKGNWVLDEENKCYTNSVDPESLPELLKDKFRAL